VSYATCILGVYRVPCVRSYPENIGLLLLLSLQWHLLRLFPNLGYPVMGDLCRTKKPPLNFADLGV
jgi:hypothetical protein